MKKMHSLEILKVYVHTSHGMERVESGNSDGREFQRHQPTVEQTELHLLPL